MYLRQRILTYTKFLYVKPTVEVYSSTRTLPFQNAESLLIYMAIGKNPAGILERQRQIREAWLGRGLGYTRERPEMGA